MEAQKDFRELLDSFNDQGVEYVIIGGHALAYHGVVRTTGDTDLYVRPTAENTGRIMAALRGFGFGDVGLSEEDFQKPGQVVQVGNPPVRVGIATSIDGVTWEQADAGKQMGAYGDAPAPFIEREEFVATKRASGRAKDLADLESLGEL